MFISILYMFRATMYPSSAELSVSVRYLVYVTVCVDDCLVCRFQPAYQTVIHTEWHISRIALIQIILLMRGTWLPETLENKIKRWIKIDQLDVTSFIISLISAQHVSNVSTSIFRSLRLICWVISCVVLHWFDVCWCYGVVRLGWCGILMQAEALLQPA